MAHVARRQVLPVIGKERLAGRHSAGARSAGEHATKNVVAG